MSDITLGNLYDVNKEIMKNQPILTINEYKNKENIIYKFLIDNDNNYFMLLCNDRRDYTIFRLTNDDHCILAAKDVMECLSNRGGIQSIDLTETQDAIEIWIKINDESFCYYFFPYDNGVIDYKLEEEKDL